VSVSVSASSENTRVGSYASKKKRIAKEAHQASQLSKLHKSALFIQEDPHAKYANLSRRGKARERARQLKLCAFPILDRCNSLLYFPSTFARVLNSGDYNELDRLVNTRLSRNCDIIEHHPGRVFNLSQNDFLGYLKCRDSAHPDGIACVHGVKVVENQIIATVYFKFTDNQFLYSSVVNAGAQSCGGILMPGVQRSERLIEQIKPNFSSDNERNRAISLLNSNVDLIVHGSATLTLTIDDVSKKIRKLVFDGRLNTVALLASPKEILLRSS
jgi:hypothetical protein